jgi:spore coat polysaccharide biosynthesis predicted glycosyltransferase SpsG
MRVLLRCDATPTSGAGRLVRGVAVAEALIARGHEPVISAAIDEAWTRELVTEAGVTLVPPATTAADLRDLVTTHQADVVHLDIADGSLAGLDGLQSAVQVSRVEDGTTTGGGRPPDHQVALSTDGAAAPPDVDPGGPIVAAGPHYAPVRAAVVEARERRQWRAGGMGDRLRVLVRLGTEDDARAMLDVVKALAASDLTTDVLVVTPSYATGLLAESLSTRVVRVLATARRGDLPRLVADHDLVLTQPGPVLWELSCIGTPAGLVSLSNEESDAAAAWVAAGCAVALDPPGGASRLAGQLRALLRDGMRRAEMGTAGLRLVDGEGAGRVAALMEMVAARSR